MGNVAACHNCVRIMLFFDIYNTNDYFDDDNQSNEYQASKFLAIILVMLVALSQLVEVIAVSCCVFMLIGQKVDSEYDYDSERDSTTVREHWESKCDWLCKCLSCLTCSLFGGGRLNWKSDSNTGVTSGGMQDLQMVARVMTAFFHHAGNLDVVPSDIAAGLGLLRHEQRFEEMKRLNFDTSSEFDDITNDDKLSQEIRLKGRVLLKDPSHGGEVHDFQLLYQLAHYSCLALASYTWMIETYMNPVCGICCIGKTCLCELCCRDSKHFRFDGSTEALIAVMTKRTLAPSKLGQRVCKWCESHSIAESRKSFEEEKRRKNEADVESGNRHVDVDVDRLITSPSSTSPQGTLLGSSSSSSSSDASDLPPSEHLGTIQGDSISRFHESALLRITNLSQCEIAYANFQNDVSVKPYVILVDREMRTAVISIRGTLSLEDCITDALAEPAPLDDAGREWGFDGVGRFAHAGILRAAETIRRDLRDKKTISRLLADLNRNIDTQDQSMPFMYSTSVKYSLVVVGHSLGAGMAALLTLMLKHEFPSVKGYAYGIPGGLVDERTAVEMKSYLTSIVLGNDLVCRLSFFNLEKLRNSCLELLGRCKVNKHHVFKSFLSNHRDTINQLVYPKDQVPESEFGRQLDRYHDFLASEKYQKQMKSVRLIPAGLIVYLPKVKDLDGKLCSEVRDCVCCNDDVDEYLYHYERRQRTYVPTFADNIEFDDIVISPTMVYDHLPDRYTHVLESIVYEWMSNKKQG